MVASLNLLALDIGEKRVGVALANSASRLPRPLKTLLQSDDINDQIRTVINENDVKLLVIGLPRSLNGDDTDQTRYVRAFSNKLSDELDIPFFFEDEALSSVRAKELLDARKAKYSKEDIDAQAACFILEDFMANNEGVMDE